MHTYTDEINNLYNMGRGGSLVDSSPFVRRVACSNGALAAM